MTDHTGPLRHPSYRANTSALAPRREQRFPFTIRIATGEADLAKANTVRRDAYGRHLPELAARMAEPDAMDRHPDVAVLLVESKLDGEPIGSARIQLNRTSRLSIESAVALPTWMHGLRLAEVTRLGVVAGRTGMLAKLALWKAIFFYWEMKSVQWAIAAGRAPIDQQYLDLTFVDLFPERGYVPLSYAGNLPHRVMAFESPTAYQRWKSAGHKLCDFIFHTHHPDILLGDVALRQISAAPVAIAPLRKVLAG
ncbi:hypothetical protein [Noviherbaspirillum galbum]|uniref:GNAT family N-acetyltransferase n=1 Tax=Noviherbaspirillum galbum TaxID=2709383 RepID=A0A6B3SNL5_9BURK|nr:hypothetical protein [Noviherbaspirillum galbum]NEX60042.1 hypothetical protein [Noviherbaspirillum galbum]